MSLQGRVALVTGGSRGIGRAIASKLGNMGVKIAVNYNDSPKAAAEVVEQICQQGGEAIAVHADVANLKQVEAMVQKVQETWRAVDILVNNAGIIKDSLLIRMTDEDWARVIDVDLNGTFYCTRAVLRSMVRQRWGRIINISSVVGLRGNAGQSNYVAAKAGVIGFTKALAKEVATRNITVNAITPGYIRTDVVEVLPQELKDRLLGWIPMGHFGTVEDVTPLAAFLASEDAKYITGQVISVDGGMAI